MTQPVVLPTEFMTEWATPGLSPEPLRSASGDLFDDSNSFSRITASGFTDSTLRGGVSGVSSHGTSRPRSGSLYRAGLVRGEEVKVPNSTTTANISTDVDDLVGETRSMFSNFSIGDQTEEKSVDKEEQTWEEEVNNRYVTMKDFTEFTKRITASIHPNDSASRLSARSSHTPLVRSPIRASNLSGIKESDSEIDSTVIGGFTMNPAEKIREVDSYMRVGPVRGLAKIFVNERLNFLSHFHSALFKILTDREGTYPSVDCLAVLLESRRTWGEEPAVALLETVIDATIDVKTGVVVSNPFNLPILEPTMRLTPQIMYMSLDQLHREFETEWFNAMKTLTTPNFQSKYERRRYGSKSKRSTSSSSRVTSAGSSRSSRRGSDTRSSLGDFLGL